MTRRADGEGVSACLIVIAAFQLDALNISENSASHEYVSVGAPVRFDQFETFIYPVDAVLAVNHKNT